MTRPPRKKRRTCKRPECGAVFMAAHSNSRFCSETCRRSSAEDRHRIQKERVADGPPPTEPRPRPIETITAGDDYTEVEAHYLKLVDAYRKTKKFPLATDYFRLAMQAASETQGQGGP